MWKWLNRMWQWHRNWKRQLRCQSRLYPVDKNETSPGFQCDRAHGHGGNHAHIRTWK